MKSSLLNMYARFKQQSKRVRISSYIALVYACYALVVGVITPAILTSKVPPKLTELLGRTVTVKDISINPFLLRARIIDFAIDEENNPDDFVRFSMLELDVGFWQTLFHFTPTVESLTLTGPYVHLARMAQNDDEVVLNFSDIIARFSQPEAVEPEPEATSEPLPHLRFEQIRLVNGRLMFTDKVTEAQLDYPELNFSIRHFDTIATLNTEPEARSRRDNAYRFLIQTAEKGELAFNGQFQLQPLVVNGDIRLSNIDLAPLWTLSDNVIQARLTAGILDFSTHYALKQEDQELVFATGNGQFSLTNIVFSDGENDKIKLAKLAVNNMALNSSNQRFSIASIAIDGPWLSTEYSSQGVELVNLFTPMADDEPTPVPETPVVETEAPVAGSDVPAETNGDASVVAEADEDAQESSPWVVAVDAFSLAQADINVIDNAIGDNMHWRVYPLNVTTGALDSAFTQPIDYDLTLGLSSAQGMTPEDNKGELNSHGKIDGAAQSVSGELSIAALNLPQIQHYLSQYLLVDLTSGELAVSGDFTADGQGQATFVGQANIEQLDVLDGVNHEPLLKWQTLAVTGIDFNQASPHLNIDDITLTQPYAKVLISEDKQTNIGGIFVAQTEAQEGEQEGNEDVDGETPTSSTPSEATGEDETAMAIGIHQVTIEDGSAFFADYSLRPHFASGIELLNGTISELSSDPETTAKVDINGKIDRYAPVAIKGEMNPLLAQPYLDLGFSAKSVELTSINPYSGTYMGHYIDKGLLSLDVKYHLKDNALLGENQLVIDQLTLGKKSKSDQALNLPLGLAIALLQDNNGVIDLGMEVSGQLDDPEFSLGSVILQVLGNIITKAVTAPFSLLSNLVGSDAELNHVDFAPGLASLDGDMQETLDVLAEALVKRPKLTVNIKGGVAQMQDATALAEQAVNQMLLTDAGVDALPVDFSASNIPLSGPIADALEQRYVTDLNGDLALERTKVITQLGANAEGEAVSEAQITTTLHIGLYNMLVKAQDIPRGKLAELAIARAKAVKSYLVESAQVAPERLFLLNSAAQLNVENRGVELTLDAQ
jgi:hypothetical protein